MWGDVGVGFGWSRPYDVVRVAPFEWDCKYGVWMAT